MRHWSDSAFKPSCARRTNHPSAQLAPLSPMALPQIGNHRCFFLLVRPVFKSLPAMVASKNASSPMLSITGSSLTLFPSWMRRRACTKNSRKPANTLSSVHSPLETRSSRKTRKGAEKGGLWTVIRLPAKQSIAAPLTLPLTGCSSTATSSTPMLKLTASMNDEALVAGAFSSRSSHT